MSFRGVVSPTSPFLQKEGSPPNKIQSETRIEAQIETNLTGCFPNSSTNCYVIIIVRFLQKMRFLSKALAVTLALQPISATAYGLPGSALLKRVEAGAIKASEPPIAAESLWKQNGAVVLVVRRSG